MKAEVDALVNAANRGTFDVVNVFNIVCVCCVGGLIVAGVLTYQKGSIPMWSVFHANFFSNFKSVANRCRRKCVATLDFGMSRITNVKNVYAATLIEDQGTNVVHSLRDWRILDQLMWQSSFR